MKIHMIRHGHTKANAEKRYCGRTDLPLSEDGAACLRALRARGVYPPASAFYTSGMLRARQTLLLLYGNVESVSIAQLAEYDFGAYEMRRHDALQSDPAYSAWTTDATGDIACPGGESRRQHERRVREGFAKLLADLRTKSDPTAAVIAHGGTIVCIMSRLFPNEKDFYGWQPSPGLGYTLRQNRDGLFTYQPIEREETP